MRLLFIAAAAALLFPSCKQEQHTTASAATATSASQSPSKEEFDGCQIGTRLTANGRVAETKSVFALNEPIHITIGWSAAPPGQQVTVEVLDAKGEEYKSLFKTMDGQKIETWPIRNLESGRYTAHARWGTKKICEVPFEVR